MKPLPRSSRTFAACALSWVLLSVLPAYAQITPPPDGSGADPREFHVVGIYEGAIRTGEVLHGGRASVTVDRPGKKVTLFLGSYDRVTWFVTVQPETVLEKVILSGYHPQAVAGLPTGVEVVNYSYEANPGGYYLYIGYSVDSPEFKRALPELNRLSGLEVSSFHGQYRSTYPAPFDLDGVQDDPRLRSDFPPVTPPADLPSLTFSVQFQSGAGAIDSRAYTLTGPAGGVELLPGGTRLHADAAGVKFYGLGSEGLLEVDAATSASRVIPMGANLPDLSWVMGAAFDTQRQRALLVTLGGEGFLYGYSPAQAQWSVLSSMRQRDFACLVYHAPGDALYGVKVAHYDYGDPVIYKLSPTGGYLGEITLPKMPFGVGPNTHRVELVSVGDYLVVLLAPSRSEYPANAVREARMYLVDPRTSQVWLTWKSRGPANVPPTVQLLQPAANASVTVGHVMPLVAEARDTDGRIRQVEFLANGQSLGLGQATDSSAEGASRFRFDWTPGQVGAVELVARATDDDGASASSSPVPVAVRPAQTGLPDLTVTLDFYSGSSSAAGEIYSLTFHTVAAAGVAPETLPPHIRVVTDAAKTKYYGTRDHSMVEIDAVSGIERDMDLGMEVPQLSWPRGVTHDPRRERVLLVSLGGEGFLYAYALAQRQWSVVASMDNRDLACLEYHAAEDVLYGLGSGPLTTGATLYKISPEGRSLRELPVPAFSNVGGVGDRRVELVSAGDYLVVLYSSWSGLEGGRPAETRMYVVDPSTGRTWLAWRHPFHLNASPSVQLTSPMAGAMFSLGQRIPLTAATGDADGEVTKVEFFANGLSLGMGSRLEEASGGPDHPVLFQMSWGSAQAGSYALSAKAVDNRGAVTLSAPVPIQVEIPVPPAPWVRRELPAAYSPGAGFVVRLAAQPQAGVSVYAIEDQPPAFWTVSDISHNGVWDPLHSKVKFGPFLDSMERTLSYRVLPPAQSAGPPTFTGLAAADATSSVIGGDATVELTQAEHPADCQPSDFALSMTEVTAYAAAWKKEQNWPSGPNPIPMSYVARAGTLWQLGERYHFDASANPAPLWWVPGIGNDAVRPQFPTLQVSAAALGLPAISSAVRRAPTEFIPGATLDVTVAVEPGTGVTTYAIEEQPPAGWTVSEISHFGSCTAVNGMIRWGPFFDGEPRRLTYRLEPAVSAATSARFKGAISFDGSLDTVAGTALSQPVNGTPHARLLALRRNPDRSLRLCYSAPAGLPLNLESAASLDAGSWRRVAQLPALSACSAEVVLPEPTNEGPCCFYRLRASDGAP